VTNRTFYDTLHKQTAVLKITFEMFDINLYEAVTKFVNLNDKVDITAQSRPANSSRLIE
jgi:hypothetical protein